MPLFWRAFSPSKTPPRRSQSLSNLGRGAASLAEDFNKISVNIGGSTATCEEGRWRTGNDAHEHRYDAEEHR